jgi:hypothetical protein
MTRYCKEINLLICATQLYLHTFFIELPEYIQLI